MEMKKFICTKCNKIIEIPYGQPKPSQCLYCGASMNFIHRVDKGGAGRGPGRGRRCGRRFLNDQK